MMTGSVWTLGLRGQAHSLPYRVPVVSILTRRAEKSDLILEEVDPHWGGG